MYRPSALRRVVFDGAVRCAAAVSAGVAAAAGMGAAAFPALEAINHGAPFAFLASISVLGAVLIQLRRRARWSLLAAAGSAGVFGVVVIPEAIAGLATPPTPQAEAQRTITVASFNIWQGGVREEDLIDFLIGTNADFIVLQEAGYYARPSLKDLRAAYPFEIPSFSSAYAQVMILSRHPPVSVNALAGPNWSLATPGQPQRELRWAEAQFVVHGAPVHIVGLHARRNMGVAVTAAELDVISRALTQVKDRAALIVAGDFNMTPWTHTLRRFANTLGMTRATHQIATYPSRSRGNPDWPPFAIFPIDHQFAGARWRPIAARRGPDVGSDHYPVVVTYQAAP